MDNREKFDLPSIWEVAPNNEGNLLLSELLDSDLQRIRLALNVDKDWRIHAVCESETCPQYRPPSDPRDSSMPRGVSADLPDL